MTFEQAVAVAIREAFDEMSRINAGWTTRHERPLKVKLWLRRKQFSGFIDYHQ